MMRVLHQIVVVCLLMAVSLGAWAVEPATVSLHGGGFTVSAPVGASFLEVRLMGPSRTLLLKRRTAGEPVEWTLGAVQEDGEYHYEAVVVMTEDGRLHQRNLPGWFEVKGGLLITTPVPEAPDEAHGLGTEPHRH